MKVKEKMKFSYLQEKSIENLHKVVYGLHVCQVVVVDVNTQAKVKSGIATIHNFKGPKFNKVGVAWPADRHTGVYLLNELLFLVVLVRHVPFCHACLSRFVLDNEKPNHVLTTGLVALYYPRA